MKHIIKVEVLENLPETRPLVAMDTDKKLWVSIKTPVLTNTIFYYSDNTSSESSDTVITSNSWNQEKELVSVIIGNKANGIGNSAFYECTGLTSVTIPNSVTSIGERAFGYCSSLTSVTIPDSVTSIEINAFDNCTRLTSVTIGNSVTSIGNSAFYNCEGLTSVNIPNSVTSIGDWAFTYCSSLTSVTIGNSVTSIGNSAFYYCSGLTSITCEALTPPTLENDVFENTNKYPFYVPANSVDTYKAAEYWLNYADRIYAISE